MWKLALTVALLLACASASSECIFFSLEDITNDCLDPIVILEDVTVTEPFDLSHLSSLTIRGVNATIASAGNRLPTHAFECIGVTFVCESPEGVFFNNRRLQSISFKSCGFVGCSLIFPDAQVVDFNNNNFNTHGLPTGQPLASSR